MSLDTILNIMTTYQLTGEELLLIYLTFIAQEENGNHCIYFKRWYDGGGSKRLKDLFESLKSKGVILKNYNPTTYNPDDIEFNENFIKKYYKFTGVLGQELYAAYPSNMYVNGNLVSLRNISKRFLNLDELYFKYATTIGHSKEKHKKILELLEWAKENDLINIGLVEFILSHKWLELEELRNNGIQGRSMINDMYSE